VSEDDLVTLHIDDLSSAGAGVGRAEDGRAVFVPRTVPGERVRARIAQERKTWARADLVEILETSPERRDARCPLFDLCGGCQLQHVDYARQVAWKGERIRAALARIGGIEVEKVDVEPSAREFGYRNRVSFTLRRVRGGRVFAGFHERDRPGRIVEVRGECFLPERGIVPVWLALRAAWGQRAELLPPGPELRLTLRRTDEGVVLVIEGGGTGNRDAQNAADLVEAIEELRAVWHCPERSDRTLLLAGAASVQDRWFGETLALESSAFLQVNREGAHEVHDAVIAALGEVDGRRIVDAYAGVAGYGRQLARSGAEVVAIEIDPAAARVARSDAPEGISVELGKVEELLPTLLPADLVVLNPPRSGVEEAVTDALVADPVTRIVYVSCDPATLARDLARLSAAYAVSEVRGFDLFPQTAHVETVVTLEARSADAQAPRS